MYFELRFYEFQEPGPLLEHGLEKDDFSVRLETSFYFFQNRFLVFEQHKTHTEKDKVEPFMAVRFEGFDRFMVKLQIILKPVVMNKPSAVVQINPVDVDSRYF